MGIETTTTDRATCRTVVLLHRKDKIKLERMASQQRVSSGEVIRRFIRLGDGAFRKKSEEEAIESSLRTIASAVSEANRSLGKTIEKLDRLHAELAKREVR